MNYSDSINSHRSPSTPAPAWLSIAVLEILSPADQVARVMTKGQRYEKVGIRTILILDPNGPAYRFRD